MVSEPQNSPLVRAARAADAEAIAELIGPFVQGGKLLPRTATEIRDLIPTGFVAEAEGKIVGFTALEIYSPKLAEIRSLAVNEGQQRLGLGKQLVAAVRGAGPQAEYPGGDGRYLVGRVLSELRLRFHPAGGEEGAVYPADGFGRSGFFDKRVADLIVSSMGKALLR